ATIETRGDAIDLVKRIVAVFLRPQSTTQRIEIHPEAVANTVSEDFANVACDSKQLKRRNRVDEWIVRRRRTIVVKTQDDSSHVRVVRFRPAKLIVGNRTTLPDILEEATPAVVAEDDVQLAVGTKSQNATVVITA